MSKKNAPIIEPRMLSRRLAAAYCGVGTTTFTSACPVAPIRIGRRIVFDRRALDFWLDTLSDMSPGMGDLQQKLEFIERTLNAPNRNATV